MKAVFIVLSLLGTANFSLAHGTRGGGDFIAANFVNQARILQSKLTTMNGWKKLGVPVWDFQKVLSSTKVLCASEKRDSELKASSFVSFYEPSLQTIVLRCEAWTGTYSIQMQRTLLHEYFRALGVESSSYEHSSRLDSLLPLSKNAASLAEKLHFAINDGDMEGIYKAVEAGADLRDPRYAFVAEVVGTIGWRETKNHDGTILDHLSGPILSTDQQLALIQYLIAKGADPDAVVTGMRTDVGERALTSTYSPVIVEALLDAGANPHLTGQGHGNALIHLLFGYRNYPNKAYFRFVVKRLLELGVDPKNCFDDNSACVLTVAQRYGDEELVKLIERYL